MKTEVKNFSEIQVEVKAKQNLIDPNTQKNSERVVLLKCDNKNTKNPKIQKIKKQSTKNKKTKIKQNYKKQHNILNFEIFSSDEEAEDLYFEVAQEKEDIRKILQFKFQQKLKQSNQTKTNFITFLVENQYTLYPIQCINCHDRFEMKKFLKHQKICTNKNKQIQQIINKNIKYCVISSNLYFQFQVFSIIMKITTQKHQKYEIQKLLGKGSFGYVFQALDKKTQKLYAVKRIVKNTNNLSREISILELLKNEVHVLKLEKCIHSLNDKKQLIQNLIFEYCDTDLEQLVISMKQGALVLQYDVIKQIMYQILLGLQSLHKNNICHRDLKPENILLKDGYIKVADLGSSKVLNEKNTPYVVSRYYRAPELFFGVSNYQLNIDIWAFAVIFYEYLYKRLPFQGKTEGQQLIQIFEKLGPPNKETFELYKNNMLNYDSCVNILWKVKKADTLKLQFFGLNVSTEERQNLKDFLIQCWNYDYMKRFSALNCLNSDFFKGIKKKPIKF